MPDYRVDLLNPDDAERLVIWLNRTRGLNVTMPAEGDAVVTFDQAAFEWLTDMDGDAPFSIARTLDSHFLWVENEDRFPVQQVTT